MTGGLCSKLLAHSSAGGFELAGKILGRSAGADKLNHLPPELRRISCSIALHGDTSKHEFKDVH
jgi:hypothetical protein